MFVQRTLSIGGLYYSKSAGRTWEAVDSILRTIYALAELPSNIARTFTTEITGPLSFAAQPAGLA